MIPLSLVALMVAAPTPPEPPFPDEVKALIGKLSEPSAEARLVAIQELRLLARCCDISGGQRVRRGDSFAPKVRGLVPYLVRAAGDDVEINRVTALYALADTLDPAAIAAIRERVKDKSASVRLTAACLLTEFQDASGLAEMKAALERFRADPKSAGPFDVEHLLASLERITGKSFGEIPANPWILSDTVKIAASEARYKELLDTWAAWWDWQPGKK
jgi:hypothetical protein